MKKKILSLLTIVCMIMALLSVNIITASAYTGTRYDDYLYYTISNGKAKITDCNSSATSIVIPKKINGYPVTSIDYEAFYNCTRLISVTIPDSVTTIGDSAFYYCESLGSITIPDSVTSIGDSAFYVCRSLTSVNISSIEAWCNISFGVLSNPLLYAHNLYLNNELVTNLVIPDSITSIGNYAFESCKSLTSVTIPDSVTSIGGSAFYGCKRLTSVTIPNSVTSIGYKAFYDCTSLESVEIPDSVTSIGDSAFYGCKRLTSVTIGNGVTSISSSAFEDCTSLTSITIPDSVTNIGSSAFEGCSLKKVNISSIEAWCNISFENYSSNPLLYYARNLYLNDELVTNLVIPDSVTSIGDCAFYNCTRLTSVTIPDSVTSIGFGAFSYCSSLESVTIPDSVTNIDNYAFYSCSSLESVTIPKSVTTMSTMSFPSDTELCVHENSYAHTFAAENNLKYSLISYKYIKNGIAYFISDGKATIVSVDDDIEEAKILSNVNDFPVTEIGNAFQNHTSLKSVTIPDSVKSIGNMAFSGCTGLTILTIGNNVTNIAREAFYGCTGLTSVTIPDSVTEIRSSSFGGCEKLANINVKENNKNYCSVDGVLFNKDKTILLQLPQGKNLNEYVIPDSVTSIGDNAFSDCKSLTSVTIPDSVTSIGGYAFDGCTSLTSVTIPDSVTTIDWGAFYGCTGLTSITIPDSVTTIGDRAFEGCTGLTSITIGDNVTEIGGSAFEGCESLTSVTIGKSIASITDWEAFVACTSLKSVTINDGVTTIGEYAFENCRSLTSVTIPDSVTSIGFGAFSNCESLTSITIPNSVKSIEAFAFGNTGYYNNASNWENDVLYIGNYLIKAKDTITSCKIKPETKLIADSAFDNCESLTSITIPDSVTSIGESAFYNCESLTNVYYNGTGEQWDKISIGDYNTNLTNATRTYFAYIKIFDADGNKIIDTMQKFGEYVDTSSIDIPDENKMILYKNKEMTEEYSADAPITENLNLYYDTIGSSRLKITGEEKASVGENGVTEKVTLQTDKTAKYLIATIKYSDALKLSNVTSEAFDIETIEYSDGGFQFLYLTCTYTGDGNIPTNTEINAFDLIFDISENVKADDILNVEFVSGEAFLTDGNDNNYYLKNLKNLEKAEIKITVFISGIAINGDDEIDKPTKYTAVISPANTSSNEVEWSVDNSEIATISQDGTLTPVKAGTVKIKATAKDGSGVFDEKEVKIIVYSQIKSLSSNTGVWDKEFTPTEREYTIYVPKNTSLIRLTAKHSGKLTANNQTYISGVAKPISLSADETVVKLKYSATGYTDSEYKIKIVKFEGTKTTVSEDGKTFTVAPVNIQSGKTIIFALYDNDMLVGFDTAVYSGESLTFKAEANYSEAKVMVWDSLSSMNSDYEAEDVILN